MLMSCAGQRKPRNVLFLCLRRIPALPGLKMLNYILLQGCLFLKQNGFSTKEETINEKIVSELSENQLRTSAGIIFVS
ncbi:Uncharacterized protein TCM_015574 [Theobroma cacao]|uniref:Uncharacterized protein n=1 Tax=Theobroma cacao TaxID=3641 RepID=A0A061G2J5_THECC|nr:Uncharacterized protein TCM_015574 [Theobroma cacao]